MGKLPAVIPVPAVVMAQPSPKTPTVDVPPREIQEREEQKERLNMLEELERLEKQIRNSSVRIAGGLNMKFAWIRPGSFWMGGEKYAEEKPVHRVTITKGFYMGVFPITQAEWQAVMSNNPSRFLGDDRPVEMVSWEDCQEFCQQLRQLTSKPIRLPTEAEWEYACRAGTSGDYCKGNDKRALRKVGWYDGNSNDQTHPVGYLAPNAWGLYDMHGNVWEWCQDWYGTYSAENQTDPKGASSGDSRVLRGGSWCDCPELCRAALRYRSAPSARGNNVGCRVCFVTD
jgi:formylglycine-generating enzyme required for sulfatase activity